MELLAQFVLRLAFGLAVGMAITSPRQVPSGFYRNHLYVTLGLTTLAALSLAALHPIAMWLAIGSAVISYVGSVCWLYEAKRLGTGAMWAVAALSLWSVLLCGPTGLLGVAGVVTSGLVLGLTAAAMLLGHWYLNSPGMELAPLRRLIIAAAVAVCLQAIVSTVGLVTLWRMQFPVPLHWVLLRWSFGIVGVEATLWMAWQTLKIPNTQSATGILYVAVIGAFVGELAASLLSAEAAYPL
jgi:hypothetical protein